jgi:hypothetical protein
MVVPRLAKMRGRQYNLKGSIDTAGWKKMDIEGEYDSQEPI